MKSFEERLRQYARVTVRSGVNVRPGQELIVSADISEAPMVRLICEEAYEAGALNVFVAYTDEPTTLIRYHHANEEALSYAPAWLIDAYAGQLQRGASFLRIFGGNPALLKGVPHAKVAVSSKAQAIASKKVGEIMLSGIGTWSAVAYSSPNWAKTVFPDKDEHTAVAKLWEAIFLCCHVDEEDPRSSWDSHVDLLSKRADWLNQRDFESLHFTGGGTDLRIGLVAGQSWVGGGSHTRSGVPYSPNIPTEEVFRMPRRDKVDGVVKSSRPLSVRGSLIEGIEMTFKDGEAISVKAASGEEVLKGLLDTDAGAKRLGEVALVPNSSRVARTNLLFNNTLYDENAACHIAMGNVVDVKQEGFSEMDKQAKLAHGVNDSVIHVDWMIGSAETDVDGIDVSGQPTALMRNGEFVF